MRNSRALLLTSTALALVLAAGPVVAATLEVSAPAPGEVHTVVGNEIYDAIGVGTDPDEIGSLIIGAGTTLTSGVNDSQVGAVIGDEAGSSGVVVVDGIGAKWTDQSGWAHLGVDGAGELGVRNGAEVATRNFIIANHESGSGTVTVDGADSLWTNTYNIEIGRDGTGEVIVSGGGEVQNGTLKIGYGDGATGTESVTVGKGKLTVTGAGSKWINSGGVSLDGDATLVVDDGALFETVDGGLYAKHGGTITVTGAGTRMRIGTLHSELPPSWEDADGWFSPDSGTILIADGARLESDGGYVGGAGTVLADMTVTGAGTVWENYLSLYIGGTGNGDTGTGRLTVADGATVSAYTIAIGVDPLSTGTVIVTGEGSLLKSIHEIFSGNIRVGNGGKGRLLLQNGGTAEAEGALIIADLSGSKGTFVIGAQEGEDAVAPGTLISAGGVVFGNGDGTLVFNHTSDNYVFDHELIANNGYIRQLAGVTDLAATSNDFWGVVDVMGGTLKVNGNIKGSDIYVYDGGTLGGNGRVGWVNVEDGGILAPGDSVGTLTVNEDVAFQAGSYFDVEFDGTGSDKVVVETFGAHIYNGANLRLDPGAGTKLDTDYTIIEIAGGGDAVYWDEGFNVSDYRPLVDSVVSYTAQDVVVRFEAVASSWADLFDTPNQSATAAAIQSLGGDNPLYEATAFLDEDAIEQGLDLLSGEVHASLKSGLVSDGEFLRSAVFDRLSGPTGPAPVAPVEPQGYAASPGSAIPFPGSDVAMDTATTAVWAQGFGAWGTVDGDGNAADLSRNSGGLFFGADRLADGWRAGLVAGYGQSSFAVDDRASSGTSSTLQMGGYAGTEFGAIRVRTGAGYSLSTVSTTRNVTVPDLQQLTADYTAGLAQAFGEVGYAMDAGAAVFEPFAGLAVVNLSTSAFTETGGDAALSADASDAGIAFATLGVRASTATDLGGAAATLNGMLGWRHAVGDTATSAALAFDGSDSFVVGGLPIATDALLVQLGLGMSLGIGSTLDVSYDGEFADGTDRQTVRGSLTTKF